MSDIAKVTYGEIIALARPASLTAFESQASSCESRVDSVKKIADLPNQFKLRNVY